MESYFTWCKPCLIVILWELKQRKQEDSWAKAGRENQTLKQISLPLPDVQLFFSGRQQTWHNMRRMESPGARIWTQGSLTPLPFVSLDWWDLLTEETLARCAPAPRIFLARRAPRLMWKGFWSWVALTFPNLAVGWEVLIPRRFEVNSTDFEICKKLGVVNFSEKEHNSTKIFFQLLLQMDGVTLKQNKR